MNVPIGLVGCCEGGVVRRDLDLGHDRDRLPVEAQPAEVVAKGLLELVADRALAVGVADVERHLVQLVRRRARSGAG